MSVIHSSIRLRRRPVIVVAGLAYWILFAFSSGIFVFYSHPLTWLFSDGVGSRPVLFLYANNIHNFLEYSGIYWFPDEHLGVSILLLPTLVSIAMTVLFCVILGDILLLHSLQGKKAVLTTAIVPAVVTTGICCSLPPMYLLIVLLSQEAAFWFFLVMSEFSYPLDIFLIGLMVYIHHSVKMNLQDYKLSGNTRTKNSNNDLF
jgi:hypothetical protein